MGSVGWTCAALVAAVGMGCGGGGDGGPGSFIRRAVDESCAKSFECCDAMEIMDELGFFGITTLAECRSTLGAFAEIGVNQLNASISAGRVVFHADRAEACLDAYASMTCAEFSAAQNDDGPAGCEDAVEGLVAEGGACSSDDECTVGECVGASDDPPMEGACTALPGSGETCQFDCAPGFFCDFGADGSTCVPQVENGMSCGGDDECTSGFCDDSAGPGTCADSTSCNGV